MYSDVRKITLAVIRGLRRSTREGNGNSLQYICLGNPMDKGAWRAIVHGVTKMSDMTEQLNNNMSWIGGKANLEAGILVRRPVQ